MKAQLIRILLATAAMTVLHAQSGPATSGASAGTSSRSGRSSANYGATSGSALAPQTAVGLPGAANELPHASSTARVRQRLNTVVGRVNTASAAGSIILTSPLAQKEMDELAEDLGVLNFIFHRNLERALGEKTPEYRLGVPITMRDSRLVETSYIQGLGALVKVHVPFPVVSADDGEKKSEPTASADSEWEKARRAIYGSDATEASGAAPATPAIVYDENLVAALKTQMFEALKNAAHIRHMSGSQSITVAILGGPSVRVSKAIDPLTGAAMDVPEASRSTVLTIRITKNEAEAVSKGSKGIEDLAKQATVAAYFDTATAPTRGGYGMSGGMNAYGSGYGYGNTPPR